MAETVRLELDWVPATALLTFNRPEALNAVNAAVLDDLDQKAIDESADLSLDQGLVLEAEAWLVNFCSSDRVEGLSAFIDRRPARYRGRHAERRD